MKRMIFLMLTLFVLSTASVNAQVRIGGLSDPKAGTVLDLNKDDGDDGTLTLGLPRVSALPTANLYKGQMVYWVTENKVYVYNGSDWTAAVGATGPQGEPGAQGPAGADGLRGSGLLWDTRDGKLYRIQDFGAAGTWMIDNLAYAPPSATEDTDYKTTYDGKGIGERGYYYRWGKATGLSGSGSSVPVQGICPDGWYIPTQTQFCNLIAALQNSTSCSIGYASPLGQLVWGVTDHSALAGSYSAATSSWSLWDSRFEAWSSELFGIRTVSDLGYAYGLTGTAQYFVSVRCMKD
jgi:uncharacterized protein (TIGR02145 family)